MLYRLLFVKQKTAYEMRISDWSSDVCSSDLDALDDERHADEPVRGADELHHLDLAPPGEHRHADGVEAEHQRGDPEHHGRGEEAQADLVEGLLDALDRKSVVSGKSVSVRVELVGRRLIKKTNKKTSQP